MIGEREHVRGATAPVIKAHYDAWYHPNNAVLVLVGGFDPDKAMAKIETLFGPIPSAKLPPRRKPALTVTRDKPIRKDLVSKFQSPRLLMGFNTVRSGGSGYYALEVIEDLLAGGKTGRLYKKLVDDLALASAVSATHQSGRYAGWFGLQVEVLGGKSKEAAEKALVDELKLLQDQPVSAEELARVKRGMLAHTVFARESVHGLADSIAQGVCTNDLEFLKTYLPCIQEVTAADVQKPPANSSISIKKWSSGRLRRRPGRPGPERRPLGRQSRAGTIGPIKLAALPPAFRSKAPSATFCPTA